MPQLCGSQSLKYLLPYFYKKKFITYCLSSESSYYNLLFVYIVYFLSIAFREFIAEWAVQFALI